MHKQPWVAVDTAPGLCDEWSPAGDQCQPWDRLAT